MKAEKAKRQNGRCSHGVWFLDKDKDYLSKNIKKMGCLNRSAVQAAYKQGLCRRIGRGEVKQFWRSAASNVGDSKNHFNEKKRYF